MNTITAAVLGNYAPRGNISEADCIIGQSFGAREQEPGYVNELLAAYITSLSARIDVPLLVQQEITSALPQSAPRPALVIEGRPSTSTGSELDSWEVLRQSHNYMKEHGLERPLLVAQAFHIGRVTLQAIKQGMEDPIVPPNLPREFDRESSQLWTRCAALWVPRELAGMIYLKANHKL